MALLSAGIIIGLTVRLVKGVAGLTVDGVSGLFRILYGVNSLTTFTESDAFRILQASLGKRAPFF